MATPINSNSNENGTDGMTQEPNKQEQNILSINLGEKYEYVADALRDAANLERIPRNQFVAEAIMDKIKTLANNSDKHRVILQEYIEKYNQDL